jgi:branched-chain amino acid transport system ATP-binding protein
MLSLEQIHTGYGRKQIIFGMDLSVAAGEVVTLMGRNGMGKTTCIRAILGFNALDAGRIVFDGHDVSRWAPHKIARAGIGLVPEGRMIFTKLTVKENLVATAAANLRGERPWTLERIYAMFPRLQERQANWGWQLSGGEQQMLAIGRALMTNPQLLILDEATEGLAPLVRLEIWACLRQVKEAGQAILVVDKNLDELLKLADRHYIIEKGAVVWTGSSAALQSSRDVYERHLGI